VRPLREGAIAFYLVVPDKVGFPQMPPLTEGMIWTVLPTFPQISRLPVGQGSACLCSGRSNLNFPKFLPLPKAEGEVARSVGGVHQLQNYRSPKDLVLLKKFYEFVNHPSVPSLKKGGEDQRGIRLILAEQADYFMLFCLHRVLMF